MDGAVFGRIAREPCLLGGERQHGCEPKDRGAEQLVDDGQARLARRRRDRIAIERVLADIEIERREVGGHEGVKRREDALVVEIGIGLAHMQVELGEPVQHEPFELRHLRGRDTVFLAEMRKRAQHPADGVAQLAIGLHRGLEDFGPDAEIVRIVGGAHPHPQDVGAGLPDHVLRRGDVAERLRHLAPVLVEHEAVREHDVEGRPPARAAGFEQRGLEPAAVLVRTFEIHHGVGPAVLLALDPGERGKMLGVFQHERVRGAGIEPDVENVVDLLPLVGIVVGLEETRGGAGRVPGVGAFLLEGVGDALVDARVVEDFDRAVVLLADEYRDRHAPGALARDHPVGLALDHAGDAVLPLRGTQRVTLIAASARARNVSPRLRPCRSHPRCPCPLR